MAEFGLKQRLTLQKQEKKDWTTLDYKLKRTVVWYIHRGKKSCKHMIKTDLFKVNSV